MDEKPEPKKIPEEFWLWGGDPNCDHNDDPQPDTVISKLGGGVKCTKCGAWFCY